MFLKKIKLNNFLSYGPQDVEIKLHDLNILVGPNGSGKSNLFEAISLLRSTPKAIVAPVRRGGEFLTGFGKEHKNRLHQFHLISRINSRLSFQILTSIILWILQ